MILAAHTSERNSAGLLPDLVRVLRAHLRRRRRAAAPEPAEALVRALCHDMGSSLAGLEAALGQLDGSTSRTELLALARAQAAHLTSMLRTADATGGPGVRGAGARPLGEVIAASVAASGLPRHQLSVHLAGAAADVEVAGAGLQRILVNLLENAHRHGDGAPVRLEVARSAGWVSLAVTQHGLAAHRVVGHLFTDCPPTDLTGLGLWSVRHRARELGGDVRWADGDGGLTLTVLLPDR